jgi:hypothetical protein
MVTTSLSGKCCARMPQVDMKCEFLRHTLATLAYRGAKPLSDARVPSPTLSPTSAQLATLRGLAVAPVRGENYYVADIVVGRVGAEQTAPKFEFD